MSLETISTRSFQDMYSQYVFDEENDIFYHSLHPEFLRWQKSVNELQSELIQREYKKVPQNNLLRRYDRELKNNGIVLLDHEAEYCRRTQLMIGSLLKTAHANKLFINQIEKDIQCGIRSRLVPIDEIFNIESCDGIHLTPEILRICWNYFQGPFRISRRPSFALDALTPHALEKHKDTQLFHSDPDDFRILKFFIYLNDVNYSNGPFEYLVNSHLQPYVRFFSPSEGFRLSQKQVKHLGFNKLVTCTGKAGTMLVADTVGIHRGKAHVAGHRIRVQFMATSVQPLLQNFLANSVEISQI